METLAAVDFERNPLVICTTSRRIRSRGFTLVEIMVVVVILGLLSTLVVPNVIRHLAQAQRRKASADILAIVNALTSHAIDNAGQYPSSMESLVTPDVNGHTYLDGFNGQTPKDPWGRPYEYEPPSTGHPRPRVYSCGKDGQLGGEGDDAEIDSDTIRS